MDYCINTFNYIENRIKCIEAVTGWARHALSLLTYADFQETDSVLFQADLILRDVFPGGKRYASSDYRKRRSV